MLQVIAQDDVLLYSSPRIINYDKSTYEAENQNWDIVQGSNGFLYFANTLGLLEYDGEVWKLYPTNEPLRALCIVDDEIFVGGINTIGSFKRNNGELVYHKLSSNFKVHDEIWKIIKVGEKVLFQSFNSFYFYNKENQELTKKILTEGNISFTFLSEDKESFYYQIIHKSLHQSTSETEIAAHEYPILKEWLIKYIHPLADGSLLLGTLQNGLWLFKDNTFQYLDNELSEFLKSAQINKVIPINNSGDYIFGTLHKGVVVGNINGKVKYYLTTKNGLPSNRIHALYLKNNILWIGTEVGISKIVINYPVKFLNDPLNLLGAVYDVEMYKNKLYVATNQGVYAAKATINNSSFNFKLIKGTKGQGWSLNVINDQLLVGHNDGIFVIENEQIKKIHKTGGGYNYIKSKAWPDVLFQTSYYGINVLKSENKALSFAHNVNGLSALTRDVLELDDHSFLISDSWEKLNRIKVSTDLRDIKYIDDLSTKNIFKNSYRFRLFNFKNQALIVTNDTAVILKDNSFQNIDLGLKKIEFVSEILNDKYIIKAGSKLHLFDAESTTEEYLPPSIKELGERQIYNYEVIKVLNDSLFVFTFSKGLAVFNINMLKEYIPVHNHPVIRDISFTNDRTKEKFKENTTTVIPFDYNTFSASYSLINYQEEINYHIKLEGYDQNWIPVGVNYTTRYQNLNYGTYTFCVKGEGDTTIGKYQFTIDRPIYLSNLSFFIYVILLLIFIYGLVYGVKLLLKRQRKAILLKKKDDLKRQREINQKQLTQLRNMRLQEELESKEESLSELLVQSSKNKELLKHLKEEMSNVSKEGNDKKIKSLKKLDHILNTEYDNTKDWEIFEVAFKKMHKDFFSHLVNIHPNLTNEDLKLCAYLRVNLSTKELAPIFNITPKSVDLKRYRLRKKMGLPPKENLYTYLVSFQ
ncbi:helix-turn-helix and ligand-binding sensor domain-containing protein [Flammeovirga pectinis]|nr:two-component regulator propeller domain-containing protein [Flammeovirga pectinis]